MAINSNDDPFLRYVEGMRGRFGGPGQGGAPARGPSKPNAFGGQVLTEPGTLDVLGKPTAGIKLSGTSDTGDLLSGPGAIPGGSTGAGAGGPFGGGARRAGPGGPSDLSLALQSLGTAKSVGEFVSRFFGGEGGTRGSVGGEGVTQRSDQSLSDRLRSDANIPAQFRTPPSRLPFLPGSGFTPSKDVSAAFQSMSPQEQALFGEWFGPGAGVLGATDYFSTPQGLAALGELGINTDILRGAGVVPSGAGAAGTLGNIGGGAGAVAAVLGLIASLTGDAELGKAAQALGAAAGGVGLAATGAGLAATGGTLGITAATPALSAGVAGAGAAFAPIAALMLASTISGLAGGDDPVGAGIADMMKRTAGNYPFFGEKLAQTTGQQGRAFGALESALPYVQSKEELGQLLNTYRNYLGTTTGVEPEMYGGDIYGIAKTPGTTGFEHGQQGLQIDWGPRTQALNEQVQALLGVLPGNQITARYGEPGGGLEGESARRLWQQFFPMTGGDVASRTVGGGPGEWWFGEGGTPAFIPQPGTQEFASYTGPDSPYAYYGMQDITNAMNAGTMAGPSWDPATGQLVYTRGATPPKPSDYFQVSPYWQQLQAAAQEQNAQRTQLAQRALSGLTGGTGAALGAGSTSGAFGPTGGMTEEDRRRLGLR